MIRYQRLPKGTGHFGNLRLIYDFDKIEINTYKNKIGAMLYRGKYFIRGEMMPRIARKYITVPFFHLMTQGINKEYIFENNKDKEMYEKLILRYKEEFDVDILAYCIMDNHVHILIRIKSTENMSRFMHIVNTQYATYYNKKYNRTGYVFKNRYKSQMIHSIEHLYKCIEYIHNNPIKAGICENKNQYRFSSFTKLYQSMQTKVIEFLEEKLGYVCINRDKNIKEDEIKVNKNNEDIDFSEDAYDDKKSICKQEIERYMKEKQIDKNNLLKNRENLKEIIIRLKVKKISYRIMAENLGIGRETLRKLNIK